MSGAQQQSRSVASQSPYAQLFRIPGAKAFCISGAVARLPISMMSLGIVLALNHMYDNWTVAGSMSAMYILVSPRSRRSTRACSTGSGSGVSDRWRLACR